MQRSYLTSGKESRDEIGSVIQCELSSKRYRRSRERWLWAVAVAILMLLSLSSAAEPVRIEGKVTTSDGTPITSAQVRIERAGNPVAETSAGVDGLYRIGGLPSGDYTIVAEAGERRSLPKGIHVTGSADLHVDLVVSDTASAAVGMEFADDPKFSVAAVTDWTAAGGHGSDAVLRTSEALNKETVALKPASPRPAEASEEWKKEEFALRAAQAKAPEAFAANHALGEFYLHAERFDDALPLLKAAYKSNPNDYGNEYDLALALKGTGRFATAREHVRNLGAGRDSADVHRLAGELDESLGDPLAAVRQFELAARADPSERNYFEWGSELLLHRAVLQARDVFATGAKAYPKSERMLTAWGAALFAGAFYDEAARRLCEASDLNPADPEPYRFMGRIEISAPDPLPCVEQKLAGFAAQHPTDPLANYYYAMALWKRNGQAVDTPAFAHVENLLKAAVKVDPKCSDAWLQLGVLQTRRNDYRKAVEFYTRAIEANPQMSEAHYRLGIAYDRIGEKEKAAEQLRLHDELQKEQAAAVEKERKQVKQFLIVVDNKKPDPDR